MRAEEGIPEPPPLGAIARGDGTVEFRVVPPFAERLGVRVAGTETPLRRVGGVHEGVIPARTFTEEGTFDAVIPHLRALRDVGVTAVELMPVATFPGERSWGYDGLYAFAPHPAYGGPDGLRRLVGAAHAAGLGVVLDVVDRSKLSRLEQPGVRDRYRELLRLRRELPPQVETEVDEGRRTLVVRRGSFQLRADFERLTAEATEVTG